MELHRQMLNRGDRHVISVFLASPSDVGDERREAKRVVTELNETINRKINFHIDLFMWEEHGPASGRPQGIINQQLDVCDLFIGLLWRTWGSDTGEYSSGFEEEFERARRRQNDTGSPDIWLCFKEIDPAQVRDPGDELKKVLAFRKEQEELKEFLFTEFEDVDDWREEVKQVAP